MTPPPALRLMIGALALAGAGKLALSALTLYTPAPAMSVHGAAQEATPFFFVGAASAAGEADGAGDPGAAGCACLPDGTPDEMLQAIAAERALLAAQQDAMTARRAEIALANDALSLETARLDELKTELEGLLERAQAAHVADIDRLVALYANMKPKDAALIMDDLDLEVTITVLGSMPERSAAPILAALKPVRARALSLIMLERAKMPGDRRLDQIRLD